MSDKDLEQWVNIKFCMKIGKNTGETLTLLTLAYGKCTMKTLFLNGIGSSRKGEMSI
jgi:hypothetical protein